jgi:hypothetical protein
VTTRQSHTREGDSASASPPVCQFKVAGHLPSRQKHRNMTAGQVPVSVGIGKRLLSDDSSALPARWTAVCRLTFCIFDRHPSPPQRPKSVPVPLDGRLLRTPKDLAAHLDNVAIAGQSRDAIVPLRYFRMTSRTLPELIPTSHS